VILGAINSVDLVPDVTPLGRRLCSREIPIQLLAGIAGIIPVICFGADDVL
jgi:hypothetical protein